MTANNDDDYQPPTAAAGNDETTVVPLPTRAAVEHAWSEEEPATEVRRPWRSAWVIAGTGLLCAVVVAFAIFGVVALIKGGHGRKQEANSTSPAHSMSAAPAPESAPAPGAPTATSTPTPLAAAPPPLTVTVTPTSPTTITAQAALPPDSGDRTDVFTICPDGHEGVVGGHTTCAFAANVRQIFYATGMANNITAFSPVTGEGYEMTCVGRYPAYFTDGSTLISTRCYGGENAEVVIW